MFLEVSQLEVRYAGRSQAAVQGVTLGLRAGDWVSLPARCRHRVESVSDDALWLAVHGRGDKA